MDNYGRASFSGTSASKLKNRPSRANLWHKCLQRDVKYEQVSRHKCLQNKVAKKNPAVQNNYLDTARKIKFSWHKCPQRELKKKNKFLGTSASKRSKCQRNYLPKLISLIIWKKKENLWHKCLQNKVAKKILPSKIITWTRRGK